MSIVYITLTNGKWRPLCSILSCDCRTCVWIYVNYRIFIAVAETFGTGRKFSETGLFKYQAYIELYLSRNQDLLLGATTPMKEQSKHLCVVLFCSWFVTILS